MERTGIYLFNPSAIDDRQLAQMNGVTKKSTLLPQSILEDEPIASTKQPMLFSQEKEKLLTKKFEEGYNIQDPEYTA